MKVSKIMTRSPGTCSPGDSLALAAETMRGRDCGMVPVTIGSKVVGIVTDRDITLAALRRDLPLSAVKVEEAATGDPVVCKTSDKVEKAVSKMKKHRVRRLPVVDKDDGLQGIVSLADVIAAAKKEKKLRKKVLAALGKISTPAPIVLTEIAQGSE